MVQSQLFGRGNQATVTDRAEIGYPGQAVYVIESATFHNSGSDTQQVVTISAGTLDAGVDYSVTVGNTTITITPTAPTAPAGPITLLSVIAQLVNALNSNGLISGLFLITSDATTITLTHRDYSVNEVVTVAGGGAGYAVASVDGALSSRIPFGLAIVRSATGSVDGRPSGMLPNAAGQAVVGFTYAAPATPRQADSTMAVPDLPGYRRGDPMSTIKKGILYCRAEAAIAAGAALFKRHTADGALTQLGAIAGAAGTGLDAITNAIAEEDSVTLSDGTIIVAVSANIL